MKPVQKGPIFEGIRLAFVYADGHSKWVRTGADLCKPERGFVSGS